MRQKRDINDHNIFQRCTKNLTKTCSTIIDSDYAVYSASLEFRWETVVLVAQVVPFTTWPDRFSDHVGIRDKRHLQTSLGVPDDMAVNSKVRACEL